MPSKKKSIKKEEAEKIANDLLTKIIGYNRYRICGSIRRNKKTVGDLDIVFTPTNGHALPLEQSLNAIGDEVLSSGQKVIRIVYKGVQVDAYITNEKFFEAHCLHLTGSKFFNIKCRQIAKTLGLRLSQYGLLNEAGEAVALGEEDILGKLGFGQFLHPETRSF